jgi:hypothetical protein
VRDICPGPCSSYPRSLEGSGERLLFIASSGSQWQLWSSNGSRRGATVVRSFCPLTVTAEGYAYSCADGLFRLGALTLFRFDSELWRTDGTAAGTGPLSDLVPVAPNPFEGVGRLGDLLFFWHQDALWRTDGTVAGTFKLRTAAELGVNPGFLSFGPTAIWHEMLFKELQWGKIIRTDGTPEGTVLLIDLPDSPNVFGFAPLDDRLVIQFQLPEVLWSTQGSGC